MALTMKQLDKIMTEVRANIKARQTSRYWECHYAPVSKATTNDCQRKSPHSGTLPKTYCPWMQGQVHDIRMVSPSKEEFKMPITEKSYISKRPVTIDELVNEFACERELHRFTFLLLTSTHNKAWADNTVIDHDTVIAIASQCEGGIGFLLSHGFIEEVAQVTYSIGQRFRHGHDIYLLAAVSASQASLIRIRDGHCWRESVEVSDTSKITQREFNRMVGSSTGDVTMIPY